jgi:hypothetical protein
LQGSSDLEIRRCGKGSRSSARIGSATSERHRPRAAMTLTLNCGVGTQHQGAWKSRLVIHCSDPVLRTSAQKSNRAHWLRVMLSNRRTTSKKSRAPNLKYPHFSLRHIPTCHKFITPAPPCSPSIWPAVVGESEGNVSGQVEWVGRPRKLRNSPPAPLEWDGVTQDDDREHNTWPEWLPRHTSRQRTPA